MKKKFDRYALVPLPPELEEVHRRRFYGTVPKPTNLIRETFYEAKEKWNGQTNGLVYNRWKYFIKIGVDEELYRFYRSLAMAERLEFNRQFAELLKKKLRVVGVEI